MRKTSRAVDKKLLVNNGLDSSIYDALVRLSQDFQLNSPLIDGHGNFGNIDGDSPAAMRYCLTGNAIVPTNKGLMKINEIIKNSELNSTNNINIEIKSIDKINTASKFFNSGVHETYKIKLRNGMSITGTENHPLLVLNDSGKKEWKLIKDIVLGDMCFVDLNSQNSLFGNNDYLLEARMLGIILSNKYTLLNNIFIVNKIKQDSLSYIHDFFKKESSTFSVDNNEKSTTYTFNNKYLNDFSQKYKITNDIEKRELPKCILEGTKKYQREFIRYLFKENKNILFDYKESNDDNGLCFKNYSSELLSQLQIILASQFGIFSIISKEDIIPILKIPSMYIKQFNKEIGFIDYNLNDKANKFSNDDSKTTSYELVEVSYKKYKGKNTVYSIKVDSNCHSFVANGFINHNTEMRLSKLSNELIDGLKEKITEFVPNFDETEIEPKILPARFGQLLINGSSGIAVGLTSNIPPHNLREVNDMMTSFIKKDPSKEERDNGKQNPMNTKKLLELLKGPDFPTGGMVVNEKELLDIYTTGEGKILVRGTLVNEELNGKPALIITEIPYTYSGRKSSLIEKISDLVLNKKLEEISEVRDESSGDIRVVLELKKGTDIEKVKNKLYKLTPLQDTFTVRMVALNDGEILTFSLYDYCRIFTDFQREIYIKEFSIKRSKLLKKIEIFEGLKKAYDYIDVIIDLIRHSPKIEIAEKCLMTGETKDVKFALKKNETVAKTFKFTSLQSESILATTLRRLNSLEITYIDKNLEEAKKELAEVEKILFDEKELNKVIINRLSKISKEFGEERKTTIKNSEIIEYVEVKKVEDMYLIYDKYGYIKCFDELTYPKLEESIFENCKLNIKTTSQDNLWCFSSNGNLYQIKADTLSFNKLRDRGIVLENKIKKNVTGDILYVCTQDTVEKLLFVTKKGYMKTVKKEEFITIRNITQATKLSKDDEIIAIYPIKDSDNKFIVVNTEEFYLKFKTTEISEQKKNAIGLTSIKTDTELLESQLIDKNQTEITMNKKKYKVSELKTQKRGNKGTKL